MYNPEEIRWHPREQVIWLIRNLPAFQAGVWPGSEPMLKEGTEYIQANADGASGSMPYVPDVVALRMARQIEDRLNRCGVDGEIVKARFIESISPQELALRFDLTVQSIYKRTSNALKYMRGKYKAMDYKSWVKRGKWREK